MPDFREMIDALRDSRPDFDPEHSGGRFNPRIAVAISGPEPDPEIYGGSAETAVREFAGDWILDEEDPDLGPAQVVDGSIGRGAEGWIPVVEWFGSSVGQGVIDLALAAGAARLLEKFTRRRRERAPDTAAGRDEGAASDFPAGLISWGFAAALAANHATEAFNDDGPFVLEAVEEPSGISGVPVSETSFVGAEPWLVLLRSPGTKVRYYVVVAPEGAIMGTISTPLLTREEIFLGLPDE